MSVPYHGDQRADAERLGAEKRLAEIRKWAPSSDETLGWTFAANCKFLLRLLDASQARLAEVQQSMLDYQKDRMRIANELEAAQERVSALAAALRIVDDWFAVNYPVAIARKTIREALARSTESEKKTPVVTPGSTEGL